MASVSAPTSAVDQFTASTRELLQRVADLERAVQRSDVPAGTVVATVGSTADVGYLFLDGSTVIAGQTLHPDLWGRIPASWKSGADIVLPDARGRTIIGAGTGAGLTARTLGATVGVESVTLTAAESGLPSHNHTQDAHTHIQDSHGHTLVPKWGGSAGAGVNMDAPSYGTAYGLDSSYIGTTIAVNQNATATNIANTATNASAAHTNMQPSLALNWQVKT